MPNLPHIAENRSNKNDNTDMELENNPQIDTNSSPPLASHTPDHLLEGRTITEMHTADPHPTLTGTKRPLSESLEEQYTKPAKLTDTLFKTPIQMTEKDAVPKPKRPVSLAFILEEIDELLEIARNSIEDTRNKYVLNYLRLKNFLEIAIVAPNTG